MARTYSFRLNSQQVEILSEKLNVDPNTNELGLKAKEIILSDGFEQDQVVQAKETQKQKLANFIEETPLSEIKDKSKELTMTEIKRLMSINDKNRNNKIDQKGLYGETNLDSYLRKIIRKGVNMDIVPEYLAKITLYAKEEILMQEYARRIAL